MDANKLLAEHLRWYATQGNRLLHRIRVAGGVLFTIVLLLNGPVLGMDSPEYTRQMVPICSAIWVTGAIALLFARRGRVPMWLNFVTTTVDVAVVVFIGLGDMGARGSMPIMFFIVIGLTALLLRLTPLIYAGIATCVGYLAMDALSEVPVADDTLVVFLSAYIVASMVTGGIIHMGRRLTRHAVEQEQARAEVLHTFGQHVSPQVVDALLNQGTEMESSERHVSVMFLDIRGFTTLSESRRPAEVVGLLNDLFGFMIDRINAHHGIVNKFLGDGFMAVFGAPLSTGSDAGNAVAAAEAILEALQERISSGRLPPLRVGIGIHCGRAVTGNVGSPQRKEYTLIGDVVNLASRIEGLNKQFDSTLLVSDEVWANLDEGGRLAACHEGVKVKGRKAAVDIYQLR